MKKTPETITHKNKAKDMLPEYNFDYRKAKPNRFADREKAQVVVLLDPEVAKVFTTAEAVNHALKSLIAAFPESGK